MRRSTAEKLSRMPQVKASFSKPEIEVKPEFQASDLAEYRSVSQSTVKVFKGVLTRDRLPVENESKQLTRDWHRNDAGFRVDHALNTDEFRVTTLKSETKKQGRKAEGQYTRLTTRNKRHELIVFNGNPNLIYRNDPTTKDKPIPILQRVNGEWFPLEPLTQSEKQALKATIAIDDPSMAGYLKSLGVTVKGSCLDPDEFISRPRTKKIGNLGSDIPLEHQKHYQKIASKQDASSKRRSLVQSVAIR